MVDKEREPESESNARLDAAGIKLFQSKVGSILWPAVGTRPEILFATNMHSRQTKSTLRGDMVTWPASVGPSVGGYSGSTAGMTSTAIRHTQDA